jgi:hypothetical protein
MPTGRRWPVDGYWNCRICCPTFPSDLPTIGETVPGYEVSVWNGIVAPKGTSPEIVAKLNQALNAGMQEAKNYHRYAEECERCAKTMTEESQRTLLEDCGRPGECWRPNLSAKRLPRRGRSARMARLPNETWSTSSAQ